MARILTIEDEENLRFSIRQALNRAGHEVAEADSVHDGWSLTRETEFDAVLTDVNLAGESGIELVRRLRDDGYDGVVVVMTAYSTVENAVSAMKLGADDYLQKPLSLEELVMLMARLLETRRLRRQVRLYERMENSRIGTRGMVGRSPEWAKTMRLAERLATVQLAGRSNGRGGATAGLPPTILILGETGTGKGLLARHIHDCGQPDGRSEGEATPFVHVNCSALPPSLIESELFGHEKGAFTDAKNQRPGLFEMAENGTIFLDEIGDMPPDLQAKILTVVEDGTFRRVGGNKDRNVSARIITATNQDLERRVEEGKFRRDLLYRLNALTIRIPSLRERPGDAELIAGAMLERFGREFGRTGLTFAPDAVRAIAGHTWPGNVRELVNTIQRVAMLCERASITAADLGLESAAGEPPARPIAGVNGARLAFDFDEGVHRADEVERELIMQALQWTKGNVSKAAKLIGMQRSSIRYRIDRYGLESFVQEMASR